jgi:hypothetical protein
MISTVARRNIALPESLYGAYLAATGALLVAALDELVQAGPCPASVVQAQTHDTEHRLLNMVQNGLEQPDRSTEGTHRDSRGAAMTAGLQLSGGGPC